MTTWTTVLELPVEPATAVVYEHGWQSWSPAGVQRITATSPRPQRERWQTMAFRPEQPAPPTGFQAEGLLAVQPAAGAPVTILASPDPHLEVASIRLELRGEVATVTTDGEVAVREHGPDLVAALEEHAEALAHHLGVPDGGTTRTLGTGWCSWYGYYHDVTERIVLDELALIEQHGLAVDTIQLDDGYQTGIGDWLDRRTDAFPRPLAELAARITDSGRTAGIWTAPFLVGADSQLAREHPDWLVGGALASDHHWGQPIRVLDVTHPDAAEHLREVLATLTEWGFTYHKVDFLYGGALPGRRYGDVTPLEAYRLGLTLLREAIGEEAVLLGCGAPLLPSIGLVDAMRISPDIDPSFAPPLGDVSQPSGHGAVRMGRARAYQHGRWWLNDPDCITVRPAIERRALWAGELASHRGLAVSGDPISALDADGLAWTRELLRPPARRAARWQPDPDDPLGGGFAEVAAR
ncbi:MAG: glycoside hydrolase family 36 protein [Nitriliruptoraceae bacterium]